jgi:hypothetical protein
MGKLKTFKELTLLDNVYMIIDNGVKSYKINSISKEEIILEYKNNRCRGIENSETRFKNINNLCTVYLNYFDAVNNLKISLKEQIESEINIIGKSTEKIAKITSILESY